MIDLDKADPILSRFSGVRIGVIGDWIADMYVYGRPHRLSREAPVIVVRYDGEEIRPGGAANSANNLLSLGASVLPVGVIGEDREGEALERYFTERGVDTGGMVRSGERGTISKTRILAGDVHTSKQQVIRIDKEPAKRTDLLAEKKILSSLERIVPEVDALVVSDYGYGLFTPPVVERIRKLAQERFVLVDSHEALDLFHGVSAVTPNEGEAERLLGSTVRQEEEAFRAAREIRERLQTKAVLLTRGNEGMILVDDRDRPEVIPIAGRRGVTDVTGAGDTVASLFALAVVSGASYREAAYLANVAAGVVVRKSGTSTLTRDELRKALRGMNG